MRARSRTSAKIVSDEIEFEKAEVAQIDGNEVLENGVAKALAEERLVAHEHVGSTHLARFQLADKALGLGKGTHQNSFPDSLVDLRIDFDFSIE